MLQELQIQSNLPLIILTILVICIVVIGYLELKKVHNSIDTLNNRFDTLKKNETPKIDMKNIPLKGNTLPSKNIQPQEGNNLNQGIETISPNIDNHLPEIDPSSQENDIEPGMDAIPPGMYVIPPGMYGIPPGMDGIPPGMDGTPPGIRMNPIESMMAGMPFGNIVLQGGPILPMGFEAKNMDDSGMTFEEEDIDDNQEINEQELTEENIQEIQEMNNLIEENNTLESDSNISELSNSDQEDSDQEDSDQEDSDQEDNESHENEPVNKNINFNPVIQINESLSVRQLKNICEDMNLPQSGNKSQLIQRIKQHQN